ncbi:MAG TPA: hypothetical protein VNL77_18695 [Roseiflexaceae bacterium]|nr:hypothetical protein [Roseiflexaceae bacterium]
MPKLLISSRPGHVRAAARRAEDFINTSPRRAHGNAAPEQLLNAGGPFDYTPSEIDHQV